uniref:Uncharacterized protein n=1 Tax=Anopheles dirus TaxID=7168 RepID=A0A182NVF4_9DIPT
RQATWDFFCKRSNAPHLQSTETPEAKASPCVKMVCVPCFIVPLLLYLWHKFVQPILLKYWNPWEKKDKDGNVISTEPKLFDCSGGVCRFAGKKTAPPDAAGTDPATQTVTTAPDEVTDKKSL